MIIRGAKCDWTDILALALAALILVLYGVASWKIIVGL
jgi:hypothetical protein